MPESSSSSPPPSSRVLAMESLIRRLDEAMAQRSSSPSYPHRQTQPTPIAKTLSHSSSVNENITHPSTPRSSSPSTTLVDTQQALLEQALLHGHITRLETSDNTPYLHLCILTPSSLHLFPPSTTLAASMPMPSLTLDLLPTMSVVAFSTVEFMVGDHVTSWTLSLPSQEEMAAWSTSIHNHQQFLLHQQYQQAYASAYLARASTPTPRASTPTRHTPTRTTSTSKPKKKVTLSLTPEHIESPTPPPSSPRVATRDDVDKKPKMRLGVPGLAFSMKRV
ncbi:hypothetical protein BC829DRAFT_488746 [Chytridium lagenaria]|nr:hypothetical protein BC829DRAFT_488746 [Chytridium lagenaria]